MEIKDLKVKLELMEPGVWLVLLDLLVPVDQTERRVKLDLQDLQDVEAPEELLVLLVNLVLLGLLASLELLELMVSLELKVRRVRKERREREDHLDLRGWPGSQELRVLLVSPD